MQYLHNSSWETLTILHKCPLGLKDQPIRLWWPKVKAKVTSQKRSCDFDISMTS